MILKDDGLILRAISEDDADVFAAMINDPEIENYVVGWSFPVSIESQRNWIKSIQGDSNNVRFSIDMGNGAVGMASISSLDLKNRTANLNVKLIKSARGKGVATRSIRLLIRYCFEELNLNCLTAGIIEDNYSSINLFSNLGFKKDGVLRQRIFKQNKYKNLAVFSYLRCEYDTRNWE